MLSVKTTMQCCHNHKGFCLHAFPANRQGASPKQAALNAAIVLPFLDAVCESILKGFGSAQIWGAGLSGGARAVALLNRHFDEDPQFDNSSITLHWHHLGWEGDMAVSHPHNILVLHYT